MNANISVGNPQSLYPQPGFPYWAITPVTRVMHWHCTGKCGQICNLVKLQYKLKYKLRFLKDMLETYTDPFQVQGNTLRWIEL